MDKSNKGVVFNYTFEELEELKKSNEGKLVELGIKHDLNSNDNTELIKSLCGK
jgi:hypothetical protein